MFGIACTCSLIAFLSIGRSTENFNTVFLLKIRHENNIAFKLASPNF